MKTFREKYAYKISLYLSLLAFVLYCVFLTVLISLSFSVFSLWNLIILLPLCLSLFLSILFRILLDPFKRWWDLFFIALTPFLRLSFVFMNILYSISVILVIYFLFSYYKRNKTETRN